jgi:transcriptional regulator with XRE-family HTH domain
MPARIAARRVRRLYIMQWREHRGMTQEQLADRLGTTSMTVSRWERGAVALNTTVMSELADALGIEPEDLYHHPDSPSPNALLRGQPREVLDQAIRIITALRRE